MRIAVAGYGIEGQASAKYWLERGDEVVIHDEKTALTDLPDGISTVIGKDAFADFSQYDKVIRTASLRPDNIKNARKIWSATNEFFDQCPAPIIGVTGTKGKGTTCSLITSVLRAAGRTVYLVGNIGVPALEILPLIQPDDIVVFELSSFQLWDLEKSPHIAVVLMIEPDHLNVHRDFDEYIEAKSHIRSHQIDGDICIYHPTNPYSAKIAYSSTVSEPIRYGEPDDGGVFVKENKFFVQEHAICGVDTLQVVGQHNIENACAAATVAKQLGLDDAAIEQGFASFHGLPHRLKFVQEIKGVKYYDDSISTTTGSAIAALKSFTAPKTIILGGSDKGTEYEAIIDECRRQSAQIVAIGQTGVKINQLAEAAGLKTHFVDGLMPAVVAKAAEISQPGSVVLLSPASASFDQYNSYSHRGEEFVRAVELISKEGH